MKKQILVLLTVSGLTHLSLQGAQKHTYENIPPTAIEKSMAHAYVNIPTVPAVPPRRATSTSTPCAKSAYVNVPLEDQTPPSVPTRRSTLPPKPTAIL